MAEEEDKKPKGYKERPQLGKNNVHIVNSGLKNAPGRRLEVTLRSCLQLRETGFSPSPSPGKTLEWKGKQLTSWWTQELRTHCY